MGIGAYYVGLPLKGSNACGITGGITLYPFVQSLGRRVEGQKIFSGRRETFPLDTEISHSRCFDTSLTAGEHGASVYCWFLGVKQPSTAFIVPLIALNAAAFSVCLARL